MLIPIVLFVKVEFIELLHLNFPMKSKVRIMDYINVKEVLTSFSGEILVFLTKEEEIMFSSENQFVTHIETSIEVI